MEDLKTCEKALKDILQEAANEGFEERFFETILHQIEFNAKRTKDHFGLNCISNMINTSLHNGNPLSVFAINENI